jgi:methyltransferase (TIGR00027 family)
MPEQPVISNVSDTARWVAAYRAMESARTDALFKDPYAERLAGERGHAMAKLGPRHTRNGWPMIIRTRLIDDLIATSISEGCDCVLNLAAGLDTRPYRMDLPASLDWIEADLGPMIDEKERLLSGEKPRCQLRRERVDLADPVARAAFLVRATAKAKKALVLTEGLLVYLEADVVRALGRDLLAQPAVRWWVLDTVSPGILQLLQKGMGAHLDNAPMKFAPAEGVAFYEKLGWKARDIRSYFREAIRLRRGPFFFRLFAAFPDADPRKPGRARWSAAVRFERGGP